MKHVLVALSLLTIMLLNIGCETLKKIARTGEDIKSGAISVEKGTENIARAATSVAEGLKGIDLLGIKTLLAENKQLQAALEQLKGRINAVQPLPYTILSKQQVKFEVVNYEGDFIVNLYIDRPDQFAWGNQRFPDNLNEYRLNIDYWNLLNSNLSGESF